MTIIRGGKAEIKPVHCLKIMNEDILDFFDLYLKGND